MSNPAGYVSEITADGFTVTITDPTELVLGTLDEFTIDTRPLGSADDWTEQVGAALPVHAGQTLTVTGLDTGVPVEWRIFIIHQLATRDGTHGIVTPGSSLWPTLENTVLAVLAGAGIASNPPTSDAYIGEFWPENVPPLAALVMSTPETVRRRSNASKLMSYPLTVRIRVAETEDAGADRLGQIEAIQRAIFRALDEMAADSYPSIPGLEIIHAKIRSKSGFANVDNRYEEQIVGMIDIEFLVWEARST